MGAVGINKLMSAKKGENWLCFIIFKVYYKNDLYHPNAIFFLPLCLTIYNFFKAASFP